ncbi:hypothetical protein GOODEAATRI_015393 [Goodea atripinnis]|uniref:Uncharacterized protein n=1 Tax=Goodea atripinnis TaxID=208336 RepID=A0ABV0N1Q6_9TELE
MFSSKPQYTLKLDPAEPVPSYSDYHWRGHAEQRREALQQLAGVNPNAQTCHVTGADYWKYFKRPLIPFEQKFPPDVIFEFSRSVSPPSARWGFRQTTEKVKHRLTRTALTIFCRLGRVPQSSCNWQH